MFSDFLTLLFPKLCVICEQSRAKGEPEICTNCQVRLPKSNYHLQSNNDLDQRFWGKVPIYQTMAYLKFVKGGSAQKLLYKIKYKNKKDVARLIGLWYGEELKKSGIMVDLIVPVPLHEKKQRIRGYNQSEVFAEGLSESLEVGYKNTMERIAQKSSQTNKNRIDRWENVQGIYVHKKKICIKDLHILLVDDIITTGATAEVCALELLKNGASKISIAAIALAQ